MSQLRSAVSASAAVRARVGGLQSGQPGWAQPPPAQRGDVGDEGGHVPSRSGSATQSPSWAPGDPSWGRQHGKSPRPSRLMVTPQSSRAGGVVAG